ncbi:hypothetical protein BGZ98_000252 [Dissophora globulifera]|nr:hypothetical protein BGZ98_000252 [Dissophora globulifera]
MAPSAFSVGNLVAAHTATTFGPPGSSDAIVLANIGTSILRWNSAETAATGFADLVDLGIPDSQNIIDMAMSSSPLALWVYYTDANNVQQLSSFNLANSTDKVTLTNVPPAPQVLTPLKASNGVALLGSNTAGATDNTLVRIFLSNGTTIAKPINTEPNALTKDTFVVSDSSVLQINPTGVVVTTLGDVSPAIGGGANQSTPIASPQPDGTVSAAPAKSQLPLIIGASIGAVVIIAIVAGLLIYRHKKVRGGGRSVFSKKQRNLFPTNKDETMVPLGLYHQDRGVSENSGFSGNDEGRLGGYPSAAAGVGVMSGANSYYSQHSRTTTQSTSHLDETIPVEAALMHHRHDKSTPQGLTHSISVSSTTSNFPRRSPKGEKRLEEKIQLQVIRYEVQDAYLISPHGPPGRLVLGTYHVVSPPRSARSLKARGGGSRMVSRSGTVVVKKTLGAGHTTPPSRAMSPAGEMIEDSSMLLTDAENQHTFEASTLKWYMTELHWKREAALLKHLKSPIFVMELLESFCIPALQNRAQAYPFVNSMGGCSSLLSDLGPVKTAQHARSVLRSISAAVDWCHRHGVVHLNLQPGSFFLEDGIDPKAEDAPWKLWDFTCARFIGEPIGPVGGGGDSGEHSHQQQGSLAASPQPPFYPNSEAHSFMEQRQVDEQLNKLSGNPLPAAYTAPELLEAWRAGDTMFAAEAGMDTWSLGCVYYEVLTGGYALFPTEAEAWGLIGGWNDTEPHRARGFHVPYPPAGLTSVATTPSLVSVRSAVVTESSTPTERHQILDPSGSIAQLLHDMMVVQPEGRISLESIMERIY